MAVILPQGNFNNIGTEILREWLMTKGTILGVIGLHENTFKPLSDIVEFNVLFFGASGIRPDVFSWHVQALFATC